MSRNFPCLVVSVALFLHLPAITHAVSNSSDAFDAVQALRAYQEKHAAEGC